LAALLGWRYYDNDDLLRMVSGVDARDLLRSRGQATLLRAESAALTLALSEGGPLISSVAAGVVTDPLDLRRLHEGGFVVWLRADLGTLAARVTGTDRPWLGNQPATAIELLYAGRESLYLSASHLVIDTRNTSADLVARRIVAASHSR